MELCVCGSWAACASRLTEVTKPSQALDDPYTPFDEADDVLSLAHLDAPPGAAAPAPPSPARARPGARRPPSRPRAPPARAGSPELRCATPDGGVNGKRGAAGAASFM